MVKRLKTFREKKEELEDSWFLVDVDGTVLGRVASKIAGLLMGKNNPTYTSDVPSRNFVIVINCQNIVLTGRKDEQKVYHRHTGYIGGLKTTTYKEMMIKHPDRVILNAVKGMLPKNKMGRTLLKNLKVYSGVDHQHQAQMPQVINFEGVKR